MSSYVKNNSTPVVRRMPNQGSLKKISHKTASAHKRSRGNDYFLLEESPRLPNGRHQVPSALVFPPPPSSTSKESQSQSLPTKRHHSRTKGTFHHPKPLSRKIPADSCTDRDSVTDTASRILKQACGSIRPHNATRGQRGTLTANKNSLNGQSRCSRARRLHVNNPLNLDMVAGRQESRVPSTASTSGAVAENDPVNPHRGFRAKLVLSQARKTIENHKLAWYGSGRNRKRGHQRIPFIMDIVLELKAQYAGWSTEDMYVTFEATRRSEAARPVFENFAHDFTVGTQSVDAYWDTQSRVWQGWKTPADEWSDSDCGSTFPVEPSTESDPVVCVVPQDTSTAPPSTSFPLGRSHFPDSVERSTASWCPALRCDYVADYQSSTQGRL